MIGIRIAIAIAIAIANLVNLVSGRPTRSVPSHSRLKMRGVEKTNDSQD